MILSQITLSENLTYGIITTLATITIGLIIYIYNTHSQSTKSQFDSQQNEDKAHVKEVTALRERMIKAETKLEIVQRDTSDMKTMLKENYEKLDGKLEKILETINKK